jgi:hypothetical protein
MATRKVEDDVMARTEAERVIGDALAEAGLTDAGDSATEEGRTVLGLIAKAVQFEKGESKDPDRHVVGMRRLVITGPWTVDPDAVGK